MQRDVVFTNMPASGYHHGGSVAFGADGKLYISNGESHDTSKAQNPNVLGGKIYRLNADGSIPSDNPFGAGNPTFALGLRNPFGMTVDPNGGRIWVTENGPSQDDEVNLIVRGGNYGWPKVTGRTGAAVSAIRSATYQNIIVPTMMAFGGNRSAEGVSRKPVLRNLRPAIDPPDQTDGEPHQRVQRHRFSSRPNEGVVGMTMGPDGLYYSTPTKVVRAYVPAAPHRLPRRHARNQNRSRPRRRRPPQPQLPRRLRRPTPTPTPRAP